MTKKNNITMEQFELLLFLICSIIIGAKTITLPIYIVFAFIFFVNFFLFVKSKDYYYLFKILIYSVVIPNNYFIIALLSMFFAIVKIFDKNTNKEKISPIVIVSIIYLIFNIFIHKIMTINLIMGIVYLVNIYIAYFFMKDCKNKIKQSYDRIIKLMKNLLIIEFISVITYFLFHLSLTLNFNGAKDWVSGTFGNKQGNIFLYFCLFAFLLFQYDYRKTKNKKDILYIIMSIICSVLTNSIALIILFALSYMIFSLFRKKSVDRIKTILYFSVVVLLFIIVTPGWIKSYIVKLTDYNYFKSNILKIVTYEDTFLSIPKDDKLFFFFGNGIGQYSSRAALTCSGYYVDSYNKIFSPSISDYSKKYIINRYVYWNLENGYGTMYSPFSSIITLQGEYGIIGLIIFLICFIYLIKKGNYESKIFLLFFIFSCLIENYIEFAKIDLLIFMLYFICDERKISNEK